MPAGLVVQLMVTLVIRGVAEGLTVIAMLFVVAFWFPELAVSDGFEVDVEFRRNVYVVPDGRPVTGTEWVSVDSDA